MEVRSAADLVQDVAEHLNLVASGDAVEVEEGSYIGNRWRSVHAELQRAELLEFDVDQIPLDAFDACMFLVAARAAPRFGKAEKAEGARQDLEERMALHSTDEPIEIEYF